MSYFTRKNLNWAEVVITTVLHGSKLIHTEKQAGQVAIVADRPNTWCGWRVWAGLG